MGFYLKQAYRIGDNLVKYIYKREERIKMSLVKEIESAVERLAKDELAAFREWFEEFDAKVWDRQFDEDVATGKLDKLASQAIADYRAGKCREL